MAFELSGEANPLDLQNVLNALMLAASSTQQQVQTGAQQLQNWEKQANYYSFVQVLLFFVARSYVGLMFFLFFWRPEALLTYSGYLPRLFCPVRSPVPRDHPIEKWNRQILAQNRNQVRLHRQNTYNAICLKTNAGKVLSKRKKKTTSRLELCKLASLNPSRFLPFITH